MSSIWNFLYPDSCWYCKKKLDENWGEVRFGGVYAKIQTIKLCSKCLDELDKEAVTKEEENDDG